MNISMEQPAKHVDTEPLTMLDHRSIKSEHAMI
jgi:hypothetical protein